MGAAVLMAGLAILAGGQARYPELLHLAAGAAALGGAITWGGGERRPWSVLLFLADIVWISLAVVATGRADSGLTLLFPLVAFAAGLCVGGRTSLVLSLLAGVALVASVAAVPDPGTAPGWLVTQGVLVLVLGLVTDRSRAVMLSRGEALDFASQAVQGRLDSEAVVQHLGSGLLTLDRQGRVVHVNRLGERTLGVSRELVEGKLAGEVFPAGARPLVEAALAAMDGGPDSRIGVEVTVAGKRVPLGVGITVLALPNGKTTGVVALFQDLTEVQRQESLDRRRDRLAAVGELAAGIAHEIRNSVLPISGSVQILAQEVALDEEQTRLFQVIERETENVERFVGALLNYTRSEAPRPGTVDLAEVARESAEAISVARRGGPPVSVVGEPVFAHADPDQTRQALKNLILNATDAVGPDGKVTVATGITAGRPFIEVADDGPGVATEDRERVFQPFYTSKPGGTGLGLAVVSRFVEDHDGELKLTEAEGGGAVFRIVLAPAEQGAGALVAA